jgi:hypothetical protein
MPLGLTLLRVIMLPTLTMIILDGLNVFDPEISFLALRQCRNSIKPSFHRVHLGEGCFTKVKDPAALSFVGTDVGDAPAALLHWHTNDKAAGI